MDAFINYDMNGIYERASQFYLELLFGISNKYAICKLPSMRIHLKKKSL